MKNQEKLDFDLDDPIVLLKQIYPCIGSAISLELEHGNYSEAERLRDLRKKVEKFIL